MGWHSTIASWMRSIHLPGVKNAADSSGFGCVKHVTKWIGCHATRRAFLSRLEMVQKATISETDMQFISQTFRPFVDSRVSDLTLLHVRKIVGDLNSEKAQKAGGSLAQLSSW